MPEEIDLNEQEEANLDKAWELLQSGSKQKPAASVKPSPFAHRKTMSAMNESLGGALVPPPSVGTRGRRKPVTSSSLNGRKHLVFYFGKAHQIGVPFQGPSGLWFVARPPNGKVVRAKNPNAPGGSPSPSPAAPATPPAAPSAGTPANPPANPAASASAAGSPPLGPKAAAAAAAKAKIQQVLGGTYQKLIGNLPLSPADIAALPAQFAQLTSNDLRSLNYILNKAGLMGLQHAQNRGPRLAALMAYAQGAGLAGVAVPAPAGAVPSAPAPPVPTPPVVPPTPLPQPTPAAAPPPAPVTPPAAPAPLPAPNPPAPAAVTPPVPAASTPTPAAPKKRTKSVTSGQQDRDAMDDLVEAALKQLNMTPDQAYQKSYATSAILKAIAPDIDSSVNWQTINRSLQGLWTQLTPVSIPAQYGSDYLRGNNHSLPSEARPHLNKAEELAIQKYTGTAYRMLNESLRDEGKPTARTKQIDDGLQAAFAKAKEFTHPVVVRQGKNLGKVALGKLLANAQAALITGKPMSFNQYLSTTTHGSLNSAHGSNVEIVVNAVKGLDVKPFSHCPHADEMILDSDSQYVVKSVKQVGGKWVMEMDQLRPSQHPTKPTGSTSASGKYTPPSNYFFNKIAKPKAAAVAGAVKPPKAPKPHKFAGVQSSKAVADYLSGTKQYTLHSNTAGRGEDHALNDILKEAGRAEKPKVMDKAGIDNLKSQGWKVFYRGVTDNKHTDQFRNGDLYNGSGIYGNGTYTHEVNAATSEDTAKGRAKGYAGYSNPNAAVMRMAMPPGAKIISDTTLKKKVQDYQTELRRDWNSGKITQAEFKSLYEMTEDRGRFAALHNYDAIDASKPSGQSYFVMLNRSILAVEDKDQ